MHRRNFLAAFIVCCSLDGSATWAPNSLAAEPHVVLELWQSADPPGETRVRGEEGVVTGRRRPFYQLTNISVPTISVFLPPEEKRTGAAVLVCPGGGLARLAYEHEGLEIADWLAPQGIAVFVLKYRVPAPSQTGLMDAARAMRLIRNRVAEFKIDPDRISAMGFSAGGEIAALLATQYDQKLYEPIDDADALPCRPTNVCLVYPGGIARGGELRQDITSRLDRRNTPPMFIVHAFPDASQNSLALAWELKAAGVPCELHLYQEGGHGFGARESSLPLNSWKTRYVEWLRGFGFFDKPYVGEYAKALTAALEAGGTLPRMSAEHPGATLADAYAAQRRYVAARLATDRAAGFKGGASSAAAQATMNIDHPIHGVLFSSNQIDAEHAVVEIAQNPDAVIETELGFLIADGAEISYLLRSIEHTKGAIGAVVPVIEMPNNYARRMGAPLTAVDAIASNVGSSKFIVGNGKSPDDVNPDAIAISLKRDGTLLHETAGDFVKGGQWANLMTLINQIIDQGYTLRSGDLIICGSLGQVHPAAPGQYEADFGPLGAIAFEME
jgi:2-keto-4-pentenoate hydratase/acetyl esterase/lipase